MPAPGRLEREWVLWVELWLRAVRHPGLQDVAHELYARLHTWFAAGDRRTAWRAASSASTTSTRAPT